MTSGIFFPLRSNAPALISGAPVRSVVRRIKLAALLHDEVLIEEGVWHGQAGPRGSMSMWMPSDPARPIEWQTPRQRGDAVGHEFMVAMKLDSAPADSPGHRVIQSETTVRWEATFEPLKKTVRHAYPWLVFGHAVDTSESQHLAAPWISTDRQDPYIERKLPISFQRNMVVNSANLDLMLGAELGSSVSTDRLHTWITSARLRRGEACPVFGMAALEILMPHGVGDLDWDELDALRGHPGLSDFRRILAEIEAAAFDQATSIDDFNQRVLAEYGAHLRRAQEAAADAFPAGIPIALLSAVVGEAVGALAFGAPLVGSAAGFAVGAVAELAARRRDAPPRWMSAERAIRARLPQSGHVTTGA